MVRVQSLYKWITAFGTILLVTISGLETHASFTGTLAVLPEPANENIIVVSPSQSQKLGLKTASDLVVATGVSILDMPAGSYNLKHPGAAPLDASIWNLNTPMTVVEGVNHPQMEAEIISQFVGQRGVFTFLKDTSILPSQMGFFLERYSIDDPHVLKALTEAQKAGIHSAVLLTDGGNSTNATKVFESLPADIKYTNKIKPEHLSENSQGHFISQLLQSGWSLFTGAHPKPDNLPLIKKGDFFVTMNGVVKENPGEDRVQALFHPKQMTFFILQDPALGVTPENLKFVFRVVGSANMRGLHENRNMITRGELGLGAFVIKNILREIQVFALAKGTGKINDINLLPRHRILFPDASVYEAGFTNGEYEMNVRASEFLEFVAQHASYFNIGGIHLMHFATTNNRFFESMYEALRAQIKVQQPPFEIDGLLDMQFLGARTAGVASGLIFDRRSFGRNYYSTHQNNDILKYVHLSAFMKEITSDVPIRDINIDGVPSHFRHLMHAKTTLIDFEVKAGMPAEVRAKMPSLFRHLPVGKYSALIDGSYNLTNNSKNQEWQDFLILKSGDPLAESVRNQIQQTKRYYGDMTTKALKENDSKGKALLNMEEGVFIKEISTFLGQFYTDVDWNLVLKIKTNIEELHLKSPSERQQFLTELEKILLQSTQTPSRLSEGYLAKRESLPLRAKALVHLLEAYFSFSPQQRGYHQAIGANRIVSICLGMIESPRSFKQSLLSLLWRPNLPPGMLEARAFRMYQNLKMQDIFVREGIDPKEAGFPFEEVVGDKALLIEDAEIKTWLDLVEMKDNSQLAEKISQRVDLKTSHRAMLATLSQLDILLDWYNKLPATKYASVTTLSRQEFFGGLFIDNMDLLVKGAQGDPNKIKEYFRYLISLKGYYDQKEGEEKKLTQKVDEAFAVFDPSRNAASNLGFRSEVAHGALNSGDRPFLSLMTDFDGSMSELPDEIIFFEKGFEGRVTPDNQQRLLGAQKILVMSPEQFAGWQAQSEKSKAKILSKYEMRSDYRDGSFRNFYDKTDPNVLLRVIDRGLKKDDYLGPAGRAVFKALEYPENMEVDLLTARANEPNSIVQFFIAVVAKEKLKNKQGGILELPTDFVNHVWRVGNAKNIEEAKADRAVQKILELSQRPSLGNRPRVWALVDNTWSNIAQVQKVLEKERKPGGRLAHIGPVQTLLYFVGKNDPRHQPLAIEVEPNGESHRRQLERRDAKTGQIKILDPLQNLFDIKIDMKPRIKKPLDQCGSIFNI